MTNNRYPGIYHYNQPAGIEQERAKQACQAKMSGVAGPQKIQCKKCGQRKPLAGSRFITPRHPKDGRICSDCHALQQRQD